MSKNIKRRVELLTIGDELLLGIRENGHLAFLGDLLMRYGLQVERNEVLRDDADVIGAAFEQAWQRSEIVITTGGLGPTSDDRTRDAVAAALGCRLVRDHAAEANIEARFKRLGRRVSDAVRRQSMRPEEAEMLQNAWGTAPGIWLERDGKVLIMLPGPSGELQPMVKQLVLPRLQERGWAMPQEAFLQLRSVGIGESAVQELLQPVFAKYPGLTVAYCAHQGMVDVRLAGLADERLREAGRECEELLEEDFVCYGNQSLAEVVFGQLRAMEKTLAVAESCTGGLLANAFTDIPGASDVFVGGAVCYRNDSKVQMLDVPESIIMQHGAVSAETAIAMVMGAAERFSSDYALSVTGFAGPGGGTDSDPVGTVYLGYYAPSGVWSRRITFPGDRKVVKAKAVTSALDWMRRKMIRYKMEDFLSIMAVEG